MRAYLAALLPLAGLANARAQPAPEHPGTVLLTIFLRHDETKTLAR